MIITLRKFLPFLDSFLELSYYERLKFVFLALLFSCNVASFSLLRPFKASVFFNLIGVEHETTIKLFCVLALFIIIYFYTLLIDRVNRKKLLHIVFISYACIYFILALLMNYIIKFETTEGTPYRILGWILYVIIEAYSPLFVTTLWSFINSINRPKSAIYGDAFICVIVRSAGFIAVESVYSSLYTTPNSLTTLPFTLLMAGILLLLGSFFTYCITKHIPSKYLEGYQPEALAQATQNKNTTLEQNHLPFLKKIIRESKKVFEGLLILIGNPYVFGIFGIIYCSDIILSLLRYQEQFISILQNNAPLYYSSIDILNYNRFFQLGGLIVSFFFIAPLLQKYGVRKCLLFTPIIVIPLGMSLFVYCSPFFIRTLMIIFESINFGFNVGIREMLFIPTSHDIKYKGRVWIEFSSRSFFKASHFNATNFSAQSIPLAMTFCSSFALLVAVVWLILAYLVGRKYELAVKYNRVIGRDA